MKIGDAMIYKDVMTRYIGNSVNGYGLVKYDAILINKDEYIIHVFDNRTGGVFQVNNNIKSYSFSFTKKEYHIRCLSQPIGAMSSFEEDLWVKCKEHRYSLL